MSVIADSLGDNIPDAQKDKVETPADLSSASSDILPEWPMEKEMVESASDAAHAGETETESETETVIDGPTAITNGYHTYASDDTYADRSSEATARHEDPDYPPLTGAGARARDYESSAWTRAGIRFAPLHVPLVRRLQTLAVLFHCTAVVFFPALFFLVCAMPLMWPLLIPYLIHLSVSTAATDGKLKYRSEMLRSLPMWTLFGSYFPVALHKTHDLPADGKYILGYHPHGIISHGAWAAFATNALDFAGKFPGVTNTLVTLDSNFRIPFYRDWILAMGLRSVSKESIWNTLTRGGPDGQGAGRAVTIVVGGARESLEAEPRALRLILEARKGFIKMAIRTGADLVPVLAFGENSLYDQLSPKTHPMVHKFQMMCLRVFKFTLPALHGRGVLNYDIGLMPYRRPVNIVVGRPVKVERSSAPEQGEIERMHALYVAELKKLWEAYKDEFATDRKGELEIIG
ncbi:related to diacylglycerol acyltransferase type 2a [Cephalotrichum gorgonifer]|uniref:Diacylglycerol O-acyltransferase n=1 Tax=Cephalotrichum gorgonifer TaxID=2041049 RepID=A0AAE8MQG4_9PEZI|nr:related to diacylglycerol acyltransferase type 2a [Cephalotrichum gorgonifer]